MTIQNDTCGSVNVSRRVKPFAHLNVQCFATHIRASQRRRIHLSRTATVDWVLQSAGAADNGAGTKKRVEKGAALQASRRDTLSPRHRVSRGGGRRDDGRGVPRTPVIRRVAHAGFSVFCEGPNAELMPSDREDVPWRCDGTSMLKQWNAMAPGLRLAIA